MERMTKQHFIALADTLRYCRPSKVVKPKGYEQRLRVWSGIVLELATFCASQNTRFDRSRWLGYIEGTNGPNGGKVKA